MKTEDSPGPSPEGRRRYPPDGRYVANEPDGPFCTCEPTCSYACKGECGCEACHQAYQDFGYDE